MGFGMLLTAKMLLLLESDKLALGCLFAFVGNEKYLVCCNWKESLKARAQIQGNTKGDIIWTSSQLMANDVFI